jgi:hypothetical protein
MFSASGQSGLKIVTTAIDTMAAMAGRRRTWFVITAIRGWMLTGIFYFKTVTG